MFRRIAWSLPFIFVVVLGAVLMLADRPLPALPRTLNIPTDYLPGQPRPKGGLACFYEHYWEDGISCEGRTTDGRELYVLFNYRLGVIEGVSVVDVTPNTIGDLIVAWGTPTSFEDYGYSQEVYWGNVRAYVAGGPFSPSSKVWSLSIYRDVKGDHDWRGFTKGY